MPLGPELEVEPASQPAGQLAGPGTASQLARQASKQPAGELASHWARSWKWNLRASQPASWPAPAQPASWLVRLPSSRPVSWLVSQPAGLLPRRPAAELEPELEQNRDWPASQPASQRAG